MRFRGSGGPADEETAQPGAAPAAGETGPEAGAPVTESPPAAEEGAGADPGYDSGSAVEPAGSGTAKNMLPGRERRRFGAERLLMRLIATAGIVGIGVAIGAILAASNVQGWIIGLAVAIVSVVLSAVLWSSRQL